MAKDTKTALLDSAERTARRRGYDGFSYADLAVDVGITKASIHHHFSSKSILAVALMKRYYADLVAACSEIDQDHATAAARLKALIARYRGALEEGQSLCLCVSFSTSTESLSAETIAEMNRFRAMMIDWLTQVFSLGLSDGSIVDVTDPAAEANATLPLLEGAQLAARAAQDPKTFDVAVQTLSRRLPV